ncbi:MAG: M20/M25/M40 family metallo-hydrolase [Alphaproteobacteria bacterium]|nr:M20/M25/M40 family metallo-hydrolase [Alphaproteobacteria bacterium]
MHTSRRHVLQGAAAFVPLAMIPGLARAETPERALFQKAVDGQRDDTIALIRDWIGNPTIAAEGRNVDKGADYMASLLRDASFDHAEIVKTDGVPGVFATLDAGAPKTVALYFMYDVKQFDPREWSSPPLEAKIVDRAPYGKVMIGRGAVNQKGPEGAFLGALHAFRKMGRKPPVNLVFVAEGEEEIGSPHFHQIVRRPDIMAALKKAQGVFMPAASQDPKTGAVTPDLGAKGIIECELVSSGETWGRGPARDIHSSFKAMVDSPVWHLVAALETLVTKDGNTPAIDGWFEHVRPLSDRERALIAQNAANASGPDWMKRYGVQHFIDDLPWDKAMERLVSQPTVNIEGLVAGYIGPGGKTILPGRAAAKLDLRLVPNQTRAEAETKLRAHLKKRGFGDIEVNVTGGYDPTETPEDARIVQAQLEVYRRAGVDIALNPRRAGSWPGSVFTSPPVSLPASHFGFGHGSGAHAPDEYYVIESSNPKVTGLTGTMMGHVDFLYEMAR